MFNVITNKQTPALASMSDEEVMEFAKTDRKLLQDFLNFAKNHGKAAGLASNQCGFDKRFIAVQTSRVCNYGGEKCCPDGFHWVLAINPTINDKNGEKKEYREGCLSWPDNYILAERYHDIRVSYFDLETNDWELYNAYDFEAQVWQHEIDHLNGKEEKTVPKDYRTVRNTTKKVGRNDPCPCESGKKYKKCCG